MKQYIVTQTDKDIINKIGETRFIVFADIFLKRLSMLIML